MSLDLITTIFFSQEESKHKFRKEIFADPVHRLPQVLATDEGGFGTRGDPRGRRGRPRELHELPRCRWQDPAELSGGLQSLMSTEILLFQTLLFLVDFEQKA